MIIVIVLETGKLYTKSIPECRMNSPGDATGPLRFALCYYGGSIGEEPDEFGVLQSPKDGEKFRLACEPVVRQFREITPDPVVVDFYVRWTKDSIKAVPDTWMAMAADIEGLQDQGYDGVGLCMGTDTAASATGGVAFLAHENDSLRIPVDFTAAQLPIYRFDGDGTFNLMGLLKSLFVAYRQRIADVMFNFSREVFKAVRLQKKNPWAFDGFISPNYPIVGSIHAHEYGLDLDTRNLRTCVNATPPGRMDLKTGFDASGVDMIDLQPGYLAKKLDSIISQPDERVIILRASGDHNINNDPGPCNLIPVIEHAVQIGVAVLLTAKYPTKSPVLGGPGARDDHGKHATYAPAQAALDAGAIACGSTPDHMVWVKVLRGRAKGITDWKQYMKTNIADEVNGNSF